MAKRLSVVNEIEEAHEAAAEGTQAVKNYVTRIAMLVDDLCAEAKDARTVADVATDAWSGQNEPGVGVLALLILKLDRIERAGHAILEQLPAGF